MKAAGAILTIDHLGRILIPKTIRKRLSLEKGDVLEVVTTSNALVIKKYLPYCTFCGESKKLTKYKGTEVCLSCIEVLAGWNIKQEAKNEAKRG